MKRIAFIILVFLSIQAVGQSFKLDYAEKLTNQLDYQRAYPIWCELASKEALKTEANLHPIRMAAQVAVKMEKYESALTWDSLLIAKNSPDVADYILQVELLCLTNRHSQLKEALDFSSLRFKDDTSLGWWLTNYSKIMERVEAKSDYSISNFTTRSVGEQFCAYPYEGIVLYISTTDDTHPFSSNYKRTGQEFLSICYYDSTEQARYKIWQKPFWRRLLYANQWRAIDQTGSHDGPISFSRDGNIAFVTKNQLHWDTINRVKYSKLEQHVYLKNGEQWEEIDFPFNSNVYSTGHAVQDTNGWILFVTDNPSLSMGGTDIVKTKLEKGKWLDPVNLGPTVNSAKNELFPFVSDKGTLYFSSNGWPGVGGLDVFFTDFYTPEPEHIGHPINTSSDDFGFYLNAKTGKGYLSSNRENWSDKIYSIFQPPYNAAVSIDLVTCKGKPLSEREIEFMNIKTGKQLLLQTDASGKTQTSQLEKNNPYRITFKGDEFLSADFAQFETTSEDNFSVKLSSSFRKHVSALYFKTTLGEKVDNIVLTTFKADGSRTKHYVSTSDYFTFEAAGAAKLDSVTLEVVNYKDVKFSIPISTETTCEDSLKYELVLERLPDELYIKIANILYDFDKYNLRPESKVELDKLINYMEAHPNYKVELQSHTDCRGTYAYNERLSENRSQSCVNYITSNGISKDMITAKGYGEYQLLENCPCEGEVVSECSEEQHQMNRRTVFLLINSEDKILDNNRLKTD
jgi:outer membrane protein OmpA-like peptidoglycan-associated protein